MKTKRFLGFGLPAGVPAVGLVPAGGENRFSPNRWRNRMRRLFSGLVCMAAVLSLSSCISILEALFSDPAAERQKKLANINYQEVALGDLEQSIKSITTDGHGFIVNAYVDKPMRNSDKFGITNTPGRYGIRLSGLQEFNNSHPDIDKQLETDRQYTVYIAVISVMVVVRSEYTGFITKIEGLRPVEEIAAEEEARKEDARKVAEAARMAEEAANRYDASKFTVVHSDFKPANYGRTDLFDAVSAAERMLRDTRGLPDWASPSRRFVSDVVFVRQTGTDIEFKTADNAVSQNMKVDSRSGLTAGQRVCVYYTITKNPLTEWRAIAIERL
jgi:hypothetical protein